MLDLSAQRAAAAQINAVIRAKRLLSSKNPEVIAAVREANQAFLSIKALNPGQVHQDAMLTNMSIQYANEAYIGLQLMPLVTVAKPSDKYWIYGKRDRLAAPDDNVSTRGHVNEVGQETRSTGNYSCTDRALKDFVAERTIQAEDAPLDEMTDATAGVLEALQLNREIRISGILTTPGNFGANTVTLAGSSQWSSDSSDPFDDITTARDALWNGFSGATKTIGYCGIGVYNRLRRHPQVIADFKHVNGLKTVTRQQLADYYELDDLLVGRAWEDTANIGQAIALTRIWGKSFGLLRVAAAPTRRSVQFGSTFRFGNAVATQWYDAAPGLEGGYWTKAGFAEDHRIVAADAGYLIDAAIA